MRRLLLILGLVLGACGQGETVFVGAGTTLADSGMMQSITAAYEEDHPGTAVKAIGDSSFGLMELGRRGSLDIVVTHAPDLEATFLASGHASRQAKVFESTFVLVGPQDRTNELTGLSFRAAFAAIAARGWTFVSRSDGSGTHAAEMALWEANVEAADWYLKTGQGMGLTLLVADQRNAFTLAEAGAFLVAGENLSLTQVETNDTLPNPYTVSLVAGANAGAEAFYDWLVGAGGREAVSHSNDALFGVDVYRP